MQHISRMDELNARTQLIKPTDNLGEIKGFRPLFAYSCGQVTTTVETHENANAAIFNFC